MMEEQRSKHVGSNAVK